MKYQLELTSKGACFLQYLEDKQAGKDVYIEAYEQMIDKLGSSLLDAWKKQLHVYLKTHKRAKIVVARIKKDFNAMNLKTGDLVYVYNKVKLELPMFLRIGKKYLFCGFRFVYLSVNNKGEYEGEIIPKKYVKKIKKVHVRTKGVNFFKFYLDKIFKQ